MAINKVPLLRIKPAKTGAEELLLKAADMDVQEMRRLVSVSYLIDRRIRSTRAYYQHLVSKGYTHTFMSHCATDLIRTKKHIDRALDVATDVHIPSRWARFVGLGPRTAAGLYAHVDIDKVQHVSQLAAYAGYTPHSYWLFKREVDALMEEVKELFGKQVNDEALKWLSGRLHRRYDTFMSLLDTFLKDGSRTWYRIGRMLMYPPWSSPFRVVCNSIGYCFEAMARSSKDKPHMHYYNKLFNERKFYEIDLNEAGRYKEQAKRKLSSGRIKPGTSSHTWYSKGMLSPMHIHIRSRRWVVKLFLSHYLEVAYYDRYKGKKKPADPYVFHKLPDGKDRKIEVPFWPWEKKHARKGT